MNENMDTPLVSRDALLTNKEAAGWLRVSVKTFKGLVDARAIRYTIIGKRRRFTAEDIEDYIRRHRSRLGEW
ncbi:MAG: helix-turn-helix domain-containing protein [Sphaerochaeta sp.]|jgi:excisionase family DNA binding protein|nr:helix-turn-helix domain-containing protein [Sphaerochaeta sp.]